MTPERPQEAPFKIYTREEIIDSLMNDIECCLSVCLSNKDDDEASKMEQIVIELLAIFDGDSIYNPPFRIIPDQEERDRNWALHEGKPVYPSCGEQPGTCNIAGELATVFAERRQAAQQSPSQPRDGQ